MPYIIIEDFRAGLDRRKMAESSPQGSLQALSNAHITRGGEIQKRLAMVAKYALPAGQTFGFAGANGVLYTFGSADVAASVPAGVTYQRLQHGSGHAMNGIVATEFYDGLLAVAASYSNGDVLLFYDGVAVPDWLAGSGVTPVDGKFATALLTKGTKLYATFESIMASSAISDPEDWGGGAGTGEGFKNMSNEAAGSETLTGLGRYQGDIAVFARRNTQIWYVDPDWAQNVQRQNLPEIGTFAPGSIISFGDIDVFFLSDSGVRSLRARDSSNQAGVSDVGTPIDDDLTAYLRTLTEDQKAAAVAALDPLDGRYHLSVGDRTYAFSYFASSKISAWSQYDYGMAISDYVTMDGRIWARSGDNLYLLGGDDGATYDSSAVEVEIPYIDGRQIATFKNFQGLDIVCEGTWSVYANTDPKQPDEESLVAIVQGTTLNKDALGMLGHAELIKFRLVNESDGAAKLSKIVVHYQAAEAS